LKKHLVRIALGLVVVLAFVGHAGRYYQIPFIDRFENIVYDARLRLTMANGVDPRIVIIDIDEKSLVAEGRWPWNRDKMALLTRQLFDRYKVKVLGFDVLFSEPDETSGLANLEQLGKNELKADSEFQAILPRLRKDLDYDGKFADALKNYPVVLSFAGSGNLEASHLIKIGQLPPPTFTTGTFGASLSLPRFQDIAPISKYCRKIRRAPATFSRISILTALSAACPCW